MHVIHPKIYRTQDTAPISDTMHMELSTTDFIANALENKPLGADPVELLSTAVRRHCTDWYEIGALTDHEIYYINIAKGTTDPGVDCFNQ